MNPPESSKDVPSKFDGPFEFVTLDGVGHFPTREALAGVLIPHFNAGA